MAPHRGDATEADSRRERWPIVLVVVTAVAVVGAMLWWQAGFFRPAATQPSTTAAASTGTATSAPGSTAPESTWQLGFDGLGPIKWGAPRQELLQAGWVNMPTTGPCTAPEPPEHLRHDIGLFFHQDTDRLELISVKSSRFPTDKGARVGTTWAQLTNLYSGTLTVEYKTVGQSSMPYGVVRRGDLEMMFLFSGDPASDDHLQVESIILRNYSPEFSPGDAC
ncbi:hypothetical protein ACQB6R_00265 [Propionibacteriaceae bacterium G1746]|uniref:hypothetical protein n=1 Tax=Aestuariimicrobium sp. G57 TaxID=3418485 RepID=UPI003C2601EE